MDLGDATAVPLALQRVLTSTDVPQGLGHQRVQGCVLCGQQKNPIRFFLQSNKQLIISTIAQYLWLTGELRDFAWSHGDDHSLPNRQLELFAQDELHGFAEPAHLPGVIQDCPIAEAGAVMEYHLVKQTQY